MFVNDLAESCDARSEINSYFNMIFMIYKTGVTNGCLNLIHQNARSYPSVEILTKAIRMIFTHNNYTISLERVDQMRDLGVLIDERLAFSHHIVVVCGPHTEREILKI